MFHLAVVTHDGEILAELLGRGGKEGHLQARECTSSILQATNMLHF